MLSPSFDLLRTLDPADLLLLFWFTVLFDVPRYLLSVAVIILIPRAQLLSIQLTTSAVIAGHNESKSLRACIESIETDQIVIVDDGSSDATWEVAQTLLNEGLAHVGIRLPARSGKPEAINAGLKHCTGEIIFIIDADTVLDNGAIAAALPYFADPQVGGVSCNLKLRNEETSLITRFQAIEYATSITIGKQIADMLGIMPNVSGACGAFRHSALLQVGGFGIEVAEDADLSMNLRRHGWDLRFAPNAIARTNGPETILDLLMQRLRWDSAIITIWLRKYAGNLNALRADFSLSNALTTLDVVWFSVLLPLVLPLYVIWLWNYVGDFAFTLLLTVFLGLSALELITLLLIRMPLRLLPYIPFYIIVQNLVMRPLRIIALLSEMIFIISRRDNYIPQHQRWRLS
jgi:cellulose synthase/poly-beta-1,6-N-acetylglucosamine synthase-like glycosyltransferase